MEALATGRTMSLIAQLPQDQAEAVVLRVVVGLDAKGAAQTLGKRPGAVRTAAHRGLKRLAELLRTDGGGDGDDDENGGADGAPEGDPADPSAPHRSTAARTAELDAVPAQRPARNGLAA